jgi:hypothetical protein
MLPSDRGKNHPLKTAVNPVDKFEWRIKMPVYEHRRNSGKRLTYSIEYDQGEYFIHRDGHLKKAFPDAIVSAIDPDEATPALMLRMAIADIETLNGMDE